MKLRKPTTCVVVDQHEFGSMLADFFDMEYVDVIDTFYANEPIADGFADTICINCDSLLEEDFSKIEKIIESFESLPEAFNEIIKLGDEIYTSLMAYVIKELYKDRYDVEYLVLQFYW